MTLTLIVTTASRQVHVVRVLTTASCFFKQHLGKTLTNQQQSLKRFNEFEGFESNDRREKTLGEEQLVVKILFESDRFMTSDDM